MTRPADATPTLAAKVLAAYLATRYVVDVPAMHGQRARRITLRIGRPSRAIAALHDSFGVDASVFITAWNPFSARHDEAANARANDALRAWVARKRLACLPGRGVGEDPGWAPEESLWVPGADATFAREACLRYAQSAAVHIGADCVPRLILHPRIAIG